MKILSLNVGIKIDNTKQIIEFLQKEDADIVCLQEVAKPEEQTVKKLFKAKPAIDKALGGRYPNLFFGDVFESRGYNLKGRVEMDFGGLIKQGNYILSKFPFETAHNIFYYKSHTLMVDWSDWEQEDTGRSLQQGIIQLNDKKKLQVINLHGIWTRDKRGDERTINQSKAILEIASKYQDLPTIILGDVNLLPETKSVALLSQNYTNLISKFGIKTTRPSFKDNIDEGGQIVDYVFVNDKIQVKDFKVFDTDISDHLPLILTFEV